MKPHELFKQLDPAIVAELFTSFREAERDVYKSAVSSLAQSRKLRPVFVQKKPVPEQIEWMHKTLTLRGSDLIAEHLLQVWFMKFQQPLLVEFCDGVEIPHNGEGSVEGELPKSLDAEKLATTVDRLFENYNSKIVSLYLHVFNLQRPGGWDNLSEVLENDSRIALGNEPQAEESAPPPAAESPAAPQPAPEDDSEPAAETESGPADTADGDKTGDGLESDDERA